MPNAARPILLVGSIPLLSADAVFTAVSAAVGDRVRRMPDGEIGERLNWIVWQGARFFDVPGLEVQGERHMRSERKARPQFGLAAGAAGGALAFGPLGYAQSAAEGYARFRALRADGRIPAGVRFQVSLPTPFSVVYHFCVPEARRTVWPHYERRMREEVREIAAAVPHEDLAIQWDVCSEIVRVLEDPEMASRYSAAELIEAVGRVAADVPERAELGFHLCYGDLGHQHTVEPRDTALLVDVANRLVGTVRRRIDWVHLPVPRGRSDEAYFTPLRGLALAPETELYLGLVHQTDGIDGARRRMAAAAKVVPRFGVATECGFGRRPPETIPELLALHRQISDLA
jgi:hypothetical protein